MIPREATDDADCVAEGETGTLKLCHWSCNVTPRNPSYHTGFRDADAGSRVFRFNP